MGETLLFTYATACGFALAGLLATGYQLVANRPARFELVQEGLAGSVLGSFFRALLVLCAAPYIIMRNAVRGRLIEQRPLGWLAASFAIAALWSGCAGVLVLQLVVVLR